ncbi:MAG: ABC transporter permease subunit [Micromonosporaceae bacterium]|nr:ABC transporter permease subunit [Micromonosporaceae bacterium]
MTTIAVRTDRLRGLPWVTWRQHRLALGGAVALLGGIGVLMLINAHAMHNAYVRLELNSCGDLRGPACQAPLSVFEHGYEGWAMLLPRFIMFIPGALGVFIGAPLVARELETGTFRFAWTQGTSRIKWITAKLAILGVALTALTLGFSLLFSSWFSLWEPIMGRMSSGQAYETAGVVFAARTLFGFMLGALLGTLIRRTVTAMAATAAAWLAVAWPTTIYLRPLIERPVVVPADSSVITQVGWTIDDWVQDPSGHRIGFKSAQMGDLVRQATKDGAAGNRGSFDAWLARHHYNHWASYQPDARFWHFQAIEASGYLLLALLLAAATILWLRHHAA